MKYSELVTKIAEATETSQKVAKANVDAVIEQIAAAVAAGEKVDLPGLGSFSTTVRAAKTGRNPATGAAQDFPAKTVAKFKAGKALNDRLPKA